MSNLLEKFLKKEIIGEVGKNNVGDLKPIVETLPESFFTACNLDTDAKKFHAAASLHTGRFSFPRINVPVNGCYIVGASVFECTPTVTYHKPTKPVGTVFCAASESETDYYVYVGEGFINNVDTCFYGSILVPFINKSENEYLDSLGNGEIKLNVDLFPRTRMALEMLYHPSTFKATDICLESSLVEKVKSTFSYDRLVYDVYPGDERIVTNGISTVVLNELIESVKSNTSLYNSPDNLVNYLEQQRDVQVQHCIDKQLELNKASDLFNEFVIKNKNLLQNSVVLLTSSAIKSAELYIPSNCYFDLIGVCSAVDIGITCQERFRGYPTFEHAYVDCAADINNKLEGAVGFTMRTAFWTHFLGALKRNNISIQVAYKSSRK